MVIEIRMMVTSGRNIDQEGAQRNLLECRKVLYQGGGYKGLYKYRISLSYTIKISLLYALYCIIMPQKETKHIFQLSELQGQLRTNTEPAPKMLS